jgi:protocatechuate 3,4-dioxygenase beta subunit
VPYPGRTPHIHVKLRHPTFGEVTSQLFLAGEARNAGDVLWRQLDDAERKEVELRLQKPAAGETVAWVAERDLVVPAR